MQPLTALRISFFEGFDTVAAMDGVHPKGVAIGSDVVFENGTLTPPDTSSRPHRMRTRVGLALSVMMALALDQVRAWRPHRRILPLHEGLMRGLATRFEVDRALPHRPQRSRTSKLRPTVGAKTPPRTGLAVRGELKDRQTWATIPASWHSV